MRRLRRRPLSLQLDSLADIMTCAVGFVLFMLMQAVMASGNLKVGKNLRVVTPSNLGHAYVLCQGGKLMPLDLDALVDELERAAPPPRSYSQVPSWERRWRRTKASDRYFVVHGHGGYGEGGFWRRLDVWITVTPKADAPFDTAETVAAPNSCFRDYLRKLNPRKEYILFVVDPASIDVFETAVAVAEGSGFRINWDPGLLTWPLVISLSGGGGGVISPGQKGPQ